MSVAIIPDFVKYQIEWLTSHNDLEFEPVIEDAIVQMLKDTGKSFIDEQAAETSQIDHIEGTMKLRGKRENIKRFLDNEIEASSWFGEKNALEEQVKCDSDGSYFEYTFKNEPHIKKTRRAFITGDHLYMEEDEGTVCVNIKQAWSFSAYPDDHELDTWRDNAHKYNIDIRLYGIECGAEFCQEIIARRDSDHVINNVIQYEDWDWECPFPEMGG